VYRCCAGKGTMARTKTIDKPTTVNGAGAAPEQPDAVKPAVASPVAAPPKLRRRPLWFLAGAALCVLGALLAVWIWTSSSENTEVVAIRDTVVRGDTITAEDLISVRLNTEPALQAVPASRSADFVGLRVSRDMTAGSLLTDEAVAQTLVPSSGQAVVGLALTPALMPGTTLLVGDDVLVVATAGGQGDPTTVTEAFDFPAEVTDILPTTATGETVVSVAVPEQNADTLATWAASGRVALVLKSREG